MTPPDGPAIAGGFTHSGPPVTRDEIRAAERAIGIPFPQAVVRHYLAVNGGHPAHTFWTDGEDEQDVSYFFPVGPAADDEGGTVEAEYADFVARGLIDPDLVPFARDAGGNFYCFDAAGAVYYTVFDVWDAERTPAENRAYARRRLTGSFARFVGGLEPNPFE